MKKLIIVAAVLLCVNAGYAQNFEKKIESSNKSIEDPKKRDNPKTWIERGLLFQDILNTPTKGLWSGMTSAEYALMSSQLGKVEKEESVEINDRPYDMAVFSDKKVYFNPDKSVAFWEVTRFAAPEALTKTYEAYMKAAELDTEKKNTKKINEGLTALSGYTKTLGLNEYQMGRNNEALNALKLSIDCSSNPIVGIKDTVIMYYTGVIANEAKDYGTAEKYFRLCIDAGYTENGDVNALLAEILTNTDRKEEALETLKQSMTKYPENQQIMIGVINSYMASGQNPSEIIPLIKQVQEAQPENASLYFAEGQLYEKTENFDNAKICYRKAIEINSEYFLGYYCLGALHLNQGVADSENAQKLPINENAEYERLMKSADDEFMTALPYFEKAFELNGNEKSVIQALKDINFKFRNRGDKYQQDADKYKEILEKMED